MRIKISEVDSIWTTIVSSLRARGIETIEVNDIDEYWIALAPDWFNFQREPPLSVGSLSGDWDTLQRLKDDEEVPAAGDLDRLAAVLRAISAKIAPP